MQDYFKVLNVSEDAEIEVIKASYKALAKKYHPDNYSGDREIAEKRMMQINEAYNVLSDERLRKEYLVKYKNYRECEQNRRENIDKDCYSDSDSNESVYTKYDSNELSDILIEVLNKKIVKVIILLITISIIGCVIHFGPTLWSEFWENFSEKIEELKYNFSL